MRLHQRKFSLDTRERFFTKRVVSDWNGVPREVVAALSLSEFRERPDSALCHTAWF